jgi:putative transposase
MKRKRFTDEQIAYAQTFYSWRRKYAGMGVAELRELRQLRQENRRLKQLVADLSLDKHMLQDVISRKL